MTDTPKLLVENDGPVTVITINRPAVRNALDNETAAMLTQALRAFDRAEGQAVAVLTGAGGHFCAGADLKELAARQEYKPWAGDPDGPCHDILSKPVIAAVAGYACAGGLGVALRCDLRVAEESATFAVLSRRWGVPMSDGTTVRLPRLIGAGRALDMLLTARKITGTEAVAWVSPIALSPRVRRWLPQSNSPIRSLRFRRSPCDRIGCRPSSNGISPSTTPSH